ncbi:hypothetical protein Dxin01_00771 [Deinococcus xinjiangensis]|uniref:PrgI family protein n=1 Tax=Deinococcus xinjiangensis TaxID=457454 RepID=A0ABP9V933_9DEIO
MEYDPIYKFDQEQEWKWGITLPKLGKALGATFVAYLFLGTRVEGFTLIFMLLACLVVFYWLIATYQRLVPKHYLKNLYYFAFTPSILEVTNDSNPLPLAVPRVKELGKNPDNEEVKKKVKKKQATVKA